MSFRKSWSESVEISRASATGSSFSSSSATRDDLDLQLLERPVELVDLSGVEVELVERERDLLLASPSPAACAASRRLRASSVSRTSRHRAAARSTPRSPAPPRACSVAPTCF